MDNGHKPITLSGVYIMFLCVCVYVHAQTCVGRWQWCCLLRHSAELLSPPDVRLNIKQ